MEGYNLNHQYFNSILNKILFLITLILTLNETKTCLTANQITLF